MRVAFWNLNWRTNRVALPEKLALLTDVSADVILLAECDQPTFEALAHLGAGGHAFGLDFVPAAERAMGCAVLVRDGHLLSSRAISELPRPERGVIATVDHDGRRFDVLAWHAPHAVGSGPDRMVVKMSAYRAMVELFGTHPGPLIVGCDLNTPWFDPWERLDPARLANDPFHDDDRIYGAHRAHALRDAWRLHLESHPEELRKVLRLRPNGPLAVSHERGQQGSTLPCRYDHILVSEDAMSPPPDTATKTRSVPEATMPSSGLTSRCLRAARGRSRSCVRDCQSSLTWLMPIRESRAHSCLPVQGRGKR